MTQGVSKRKDLMKISKVIFHIKPIPSYPWWECKNRFYIYIYKEPYNVLERIELCLLHLWLHACRMRISGIEKKSKRGKVRERESRLTVVGYSSRWMTPNEMPAWGSACHSGNNPVLWYTQSLTFIFFFFCPFFLFTISLFWILFYFSSLGISQTLNIMKKRSSIFHI